MEKSLIYDRKDDISDENVVAMAIKYCFNVAEIHNRCWK